MKHVFLFNEDSRASVYGIGTYIRQLSLCLADEKDVSLSIVHLHSVENEFKKEKSNGYMIYHFPDSCDAKVNTIYNDRYYRNIWFILSSFVNIKDDSDKLFFLLNYYYQYPLIKLIKKRYPYSFILFTVHYQNWSFPIKGNTSYFRTIIGNLKKSKSDKEDDIVIQYEMEKKIYNDVDHVICLSRYTRKLLLEDYHIPEDKISLIYNGLKDEAFSLSKEEKNKMKKRLFFSESSRIILFVGRLDEIKGVDILIDAFKLVLKKMPDSHLVIIGGGDFSTYLEKSKGFWRKITFTGKLEKNDLYQFYQIADVGVMPSTHEQCSYVAIEMMMFGLPMVISTSTGLSEMLTGENTRYKVAVKELGDRVYISAVSLKNKVIKAISDKGYSKRIRGQYDNVYGLKTMKNKYMNHIFNSDKSND